MRIAVLLINRLFLVNLSLEYMAVTDDDPVDATQLFESSFFISASFRLINSNSSGKQ